jgi:aspartyl-tRNA(Asn)/glutamyl-tRNA(Gln) amidotransferase subunit A
MLARMAWPPPMRISGAPLRAIAALSSRRMMASLLKRSLAAQLGIDVLGTLGPEARGGLPAEARPIAARPPRSLAPGAAHLPARGSWPLSSAALQARYAAGADSPREAVERAFAAARALAARAPGGGGPLLALDETRARADADAATRRFASRKPLGPLDGVPFAVKEETDLAGLRSRVGTEFLGELPAAADATCVARLRAAGAIALGQTAMTELGLSPIGVNPLRAMPRNPHHAGHVAGGSSTGSAASVAAGICPVAVAADGGGSIRIPASLCGVFGLKPTFGRVSRGGDFYRGTMNHLGPIGSTPADLARFLEVVSGPDPRDAISSWAPPPNGAFAAALESSVRGLRIGVIEHAWEEAAAEVAAHGRAALAALEAAGATLAPASIPLSAHAPQIGYLSIGLEELADLVDAPAEHRAKIGPDTRVSLSALTAFSSTDYLDTQRLRARVREQTAAAFAEFDLLALPAASITAPPISDGEAASGILDAVALHGLCRTMMLGNLTGLPCGVAPVGADDHGLPVGVQLMGDAWDEAAVIAALAELERAGVARALEPKDSARSVL